MKTRVLSAAFLVGIGLSPTFGFAKAQPHKVAKPIPARAVPFSKEALKENTAWLSSHGLIELGEKSRSPSTQSGLDLSEVPAEYFALVREITGIRTPEAVDQLISRLEQNYESLDPHSKYIALHIAALKNLRGIVFRVAPIFQANHVVLSNALRQLKHVQENLEIECPEVHCRAVWDYLQFPARVPAERFSDVNQVTDFAVSTLLPDMRKMADRLRVLLPRAATKPILADLRLVRGRIGAPDQRTGALAPYQRVVTSAAIENEIASIFSFGIHGSLLVNAYDLSALPRMLETMGKLYGLDGFLFDPADGVTTRQWVMQYQGGAYTQFLQLRPGAENNLVSAYEYLKSADDYYAHSVNALRSQLEPANRIANAALLPEIFWANPERTEITLRNRTELVRGQASLRSMVGSEIVQVNLQSFYNQPIRDLKVFLPTAFDHTPVRRDRTLASGGVIRNSWNLSAGKATAWNAAPYNQIFPGALPGRTPRELVRNLEESLGGGALAWILARLVY